MGLFHNQLYYTMTSKHLKFCLFYLQTNDPGVAYKMVYPKANNHSVYAAASRLMARPDVSAWIKETEERVHDRALREIEEDMGGVLKNQLLTINQKRAVLTKIITGETKRVRHIKTKYSYEKVEDDLPVYAVLRAIDMDTRLENFYNCLTNAEIWRKTQNQYVNTPTLQQQVNILIAQTTAQKEEDNEHQISPVGAEQLVPENVPDVSSPQPEPCSSRVQGATRQSEVKSGKLVLENTSLLNKRLSGQKDTNQLTILNNFSSCNQNQTSPFVNTNST